MERETAAQLPFPAPLAAPCWPCVGSELAGEPGPELLAGSLSTPLRGALLSPPSKSATGAVMVLSRRLLPDDPELLFERGKGLRPSPPRVRALTWSSTALPSMSSCMPSPPSPAVSPQLPPRSSPPPNAAPTRPRSADIRRLRAAAGSDAWPRSKLHLALTYPSAAVTTSPVQGSRGRPCTSCRPGSSCRAGSGPAVQTLRLLAHACCPTSTSASNPEAGQLLHLGRMPDCGAPGTEIGPALRCWKEPAPCFLLEPSFSRRFSRSLSTSAAGLSGCSDATKSQAWDSMWRMDTSVAMPAGWRAERRKSSIMPSCARGGGLLPPADARASAPEAAAGNWPASSALDPADGVTGSGRSVVPWAPPDTTSIEALGSPARRRGARRGPVQDPCPLPSPVGAVASAFGGWPASPPALPDPQAVACSGTEAGGEPGRNPLTSAPCTPTSGDSSRHPAPSPWGTLRRSTPCLLPLREDEEAATALRFAACVLPSEATPPVSVCGCGRPAPTIASTEQLPAPCTPLPLSPSAQGLIRPCVLPSLAPDCELSDAAQA